MTSFARIQTLPLLTQTLDRYFQQQSCASETLAAWLRMQCHPMQICALVQEILRSPRLLQQVAARSYQHGNGFLKVVLADRGYKLRLHIWFAGQACEENLHDHRWGFVSTILAGTLHSEIWRDAADHEAADLETTEYTYHAAKTQQEAFKQPLGSRRYVLARRAAYRAGEAYVMPEQRLHRIMNHGDRLVATLMCTAPTQQGTTRLIPMHDGIDPNIQPPRTTPEQLAAALTRFLAEYLAQHQYS